MQTNPEILKASAARVPGWPARLSVLLAVLAFIAPVRAQTLTQNFGLKAGWNAIWLEVKPSNGLPATVFAGIPVESVWTYNAPASSAQFIQDPAEADWNRGLWRMYVPTNRVESINNNLFAILANRAYLVKVTSNATLTVTGRPSFRPLDWVPDAFNLRGLPVDSNAPPTFANFFRPSAAHFDSRTGLPTKISRLNASGRWAPVAPTDTIRAGEALWIYCNGASDYQGPMEVALDVGDGLAYDTTVEEFTLRISNRSASSLAGTLADVSGLANPALAYARTAPATGTEWAGLPSALPLNIAAGGSLPLRIAIRRAAFATAGYQTVVAVNSGAGQRVLLPVSAEKFAPDAGSGGDRLAKVLTPQDDAVSHAGLWIGRAQIDSVNEVNNPTDKTLPRAAGSPFSLTLLLHVDSAGQTRLLREVIQLFDPGTTSTDTNGVAVIITPRREVLLTEDSLLGQYEAVFPRDGKSVGRRLSSSSYDFDTSAGNFLPLTGWFGGSRTIDGTITLAPGFATNPFFHRYHPDHDNLDASFTGARREAYEVTRRISLTFSSSAPAGVNTPDYGYQTLAGTYRETIGGLHRENLIVQGAFLLHRASTTAVLNQ